ncbi:sugar transferase [Collinsella intestinalis]|uniref:sugar transferase n=1 Tax=Collinsella intestinalis TaxID=147207 RepID=UPI001959C23E|nr:sugar transferase [Collinsella intestinalis]
MGQMEQGVPPAIDGRALDAPRERAAAGVVVAPEEALLEASVPVAKTNTEGKAGHPARTAIGSATQAAAERPCTGRRGYRFCKRVFGIVFNLLVLIYLCWLYAIVAIAIKLDDPHGPVFFKQVRVGKDGKEFQTYKFRSMAIDAETRLAQLLERNEKTGEEFKLHNNPRATRVGCVIRKVSLAPVLIGTPGDGEPTKFLSHPVKPSLDLQKCKRRPGTFFGARNHYASFQFLSFGCPKGTSGRSLRLSAQVPFASAGTAV